MSVQTELEDAIINRQVVRFVYDGLQREVEPFLLGTTTAGRPALRAYLIRWSRLLLRLSRAYLPRLPGFIRETARTYLSAER